MWDLKGRLEAAVGLAIPGAAIQVEGNGWIVRDRAGRVVGEAGPMAADAPPWAAPVFGLEVAIDPAPRRPARFEPLPTTPASERVLALLVPDGTEVGRVADVIRASGGDLLEAVVVESDYRGNRAARRQRGASLSGSPSGRRTVRCATPKWTRPSPDCSPPWRRSSGSGGEMRALTRGE